MDLGPIDADRDVELGVFVMQRTGLPRYSFGTLNYRELEMNIGQRAPSRRRTEQRVVGGHR
jgi:hypothetical protein